MLSRFYFTFGLACLTASGYAWAQCEQAHDLPRILCEVTYAGETQNIWACPTSEPYQVKARNIRNRFQFKTYQTNASNLSPRIDIYVYQEDVAEARLIQHVVIQPPYPTAKPNARVPLMGVQHLYAGPAERELIYHCDIVGDKP